MFISEQDAPENSQLTMLQDFCDFCQVFPSRFFLTINPNKVLKLPQNGFRGRNLIFGNLWHIFGFPLVCFDVSLMADAVNDLTEF